MNNDSSNNSINWLKKSNLRPTRQRIAIAEALVGDGNDRHVTAESLFSSVNENGEVISLATIYNTLNTFRDAGLLTEVVVDPHKSYFCTIRELNFFGVAAFVTTFSNSNAWSIPVFIEAETSYNVASFSGKI